MQIRKKVFETNSSSSHSVVIPDSKESMFCEIDEKKSIYLTGDFYGWQDGILTDWYSKADYCYTYAATQSSNRENDLKLLREVIKDYTKLDVEFSIDNDASDIDEIGIDHQSSDTVEEYFESYNQLKRLIFDNKYEIELGNDNN